MFKGKDSRVKCRSLGQRDGKGFNQGERAIKNYQTGIETKNRWVIGNKGQLRIRCYRLKKTT